MGRGGCAPFSQKTDLLRTCNLMADSCLGLCWVSLCPLAVWGASPCPYLNSYPEMAAGARLSSLAPRRGVNAVSWVPELCAIEVVLAQDVWVGFPP